MMTVSPTASPSTLNGREELANGVTPARLTTAGTYMSRSQDILPVAHTKTLESVMAATDLLDQHHSSSFSSQRPSSATGLLPKMHSSSTLSMKEHKASGGDKMQPHPPVKEPLLPHRAVKVNPLTLTQKPAVRRVADMRINRTKSTVTELQKERNELQAHVVDLSRRVDGKQTEIQQLRMELKRERERSLTAAAGETPSVDFTLMPRPLSITRHMGVHTEYVDAATSPVPNNSSSTHPPVTPRRHTPGTSIECDDEEFNNGDSPSYNENSNEDDRWERMSVCSEVSLACLQDRIVQMQETHFSTTEELQATLAELTELQDIVDQLYNDNQRLTDERNMFDEVAQTQHKKIENLRLQVENLKYLLLTGYESMAGKKREAAAITEREHKLFEALQTAHKEHNDLKFVYLECANELSSVREESARHEQMSAALRVRLQLATRVNEPTVDGQCGRCATLAADCAVLQSQLHAQCSRDENMADMRCTITSLSHSLQSALEERGIVPDEGSSRGDTMTTEESEALRLSYDALHLDNAKLTTKLNDERAKFEEEQADWRQFQADLLTAVKVANDFKTEAQVDIERLNEDLAALRDLHARTNDELGLLKQQAARSQLLHRASPAVSNGMNGTPMPMTPTPAISKTASSSSIMAPNSCSKVVVASSHTRTPLSSGTLPIPRPQQASSSSSTLTAGSGEDIKSRIDAYLAAVSPSASLSATAAIGRVGAKRTPVKTVIEELNEASNEPSSPSRDTRPSCKVRLNFNTERPTSVELSKSNMNLASSLNVSGHETYASVASLASPAAVDSHRRLPKSNLKPAQSDTDVQQSSSRSAACLTPSTRGVTVDELSTTSPTKAPSSSTAAPTAITATPSSASVANIVRPGILTSKAENDSARKPSTSYQIDADPLAQLMKDAPRGSRRNALLKWVKDRTCGYKDVDVTNFSSCWNDGLAFCALFHSIAPTKMPFHQLSVTNKRDNFTRALACGRELGIDTDGTMNVDELVSLERPDWQLIMAYVTKVYAVAQH